MSAAALSPLAAVLGVVAYWIVLGMVGVWLGRERDAVHVLYPAGAAGALLLAWCGWLCLGAPPQALVLPLGLPDLPFHVRVDALSGFFLLLLGLAAAGVLVYATGYFRGEADPRPGLTCLQLHLFLAAMALVLVADDAYLFMVAWESMAVSSYFLVVTDHKVAEIRSAGFLYLLLAHVGAVAILLAFGVLQAGAGQYTFEAMRGAVRSEQWAGLAFVLALLGFGAKAGFLPLHAWLPEAHPAAPSPVSALMSSVMLKTAVYGLLRVGFDLAGEPAAWWGATALAVGLLSALYGVMFAAVQTDMKRLLAWSSIENLGVVLAALGLSLVFRHHGMKTLAALALAAGLYHCLNHALIKSLLFCATGSVMHATAQRSLGHLGGLIRRMPWVAATALVGALAIAGLPPLNGFASEWLLLQAFLASPGIPGSYLRMLVPLATAALVLAAAFSAYVMVKFYGVVFLGRPREPGLSQARDAGPWERGALAALAAACVLLGLMPVQVLRALDPVSLLLLGEGVGAPLEGGWLFLAPVSAQRASYSPLLFLSVIAAAIAGAWLLVRQVWRGRTRRADAWDCGYPAQTARMQDSAEGFGQPVKQIFEPFFRIERQVPDPFDEAPRYAARTSDRLWHWLYLPVAAAVARLSGLLAPLQHGRVHLYLVYSFATLLFLLLVIRA